MKLLEKSIEDLDNSIEESFNVIRDTGHLVEAKIVKKRYGGKMYATTSKMIDAVNLYEYGKINKSELEMIASWAEDPGSAIRVARMIAGLK
jgi:hypothetical protein